MAPLLLDVHHLYIVISFWVVIMELGVKRTTIHVTGGRKGGARINRGPVVSWLGII